MRQVLFRQKKGFSIKDLVLISLFAALMAACALINRFIPIYIFGIPFTLQIGFAYLAGVILGPGKGTAAMLVYLLIGLAGVPVFGSPPYGSIAYLYNPTFGFLPGFVGQAGLSGLVGHKSRKTWVLIMAGLLGVVVAYIFGIGYLYLVKNFFMAEKQNLLDLAAQFIKGFFIIDTVKIIFSAGLAKSFSKLKLA